MYKLGVIVPYRNREKQLPVFIDSISKYIREQEIQFEIIIVEQADDLDFNRAKLLNIGFLKAEKLGCDYVVFHDIDMIPLQADYSYSNSPQHLVTDFDLPDGISRTIFDEYFGGVTLFNNKTFKRINGYSNNYYGWGFEDDDLFLRCQENYVKLSNKKYINKTKDGLSLEFNGENSFVTCPNFFKPGKSYSIFLTFEILPFLLDPVKAYDEYSIFSIAGYDITLSINSFRDILFQFWKSDYSSISIASKDKYHPCALNTCIVINEDSRPNRVDFYINGELQGVNTYDKLLDVSLNKYFYLGVGDPNRKKLHNYFKGNIDSFCVVSQALDSKQIKKISQDKHNNYFKYINQRYLECYYDSKFISNKKLIDLSKHKRHGSIFNCKQVEVARDNEVSIPIPNRRKGMFKLLEHQENGYRDGYWINWNTRNHQIHYFKEYLEQRTNYTADGLTTLEYKTISDRDLGMYRHLKVTL